MPVLPSGPLVLETLGEHHGLTLNGLLSRLQPAGAYPCRTFGVVSAAASADRRLVPGLRAVGHGVTLTAFIRRCSS